MKDSQTFEEFEIKEWKNKLKRIKSHNKPAKKDVPINVNGYA